MPQQTPCNNRIGGRRLKLVAIHLGVGNSRDQEDAQKLAKQICEDVMLNRCNDEHSDTCSCRLNSSDEVAHLSAERAVVKLVEKMERLQPLNCGYGSNLNMIGQVECDASLMCDKTQAWAGVGAISACKNPILLAKSLYDHRTLKRPLGLIQPNFLAGPGAKVFMREHCPHLITRDSKMISPESFKYYQKFKSRYDAAVKNLQRDKIVNQTQTNVINLPKETNSVPVQLDHGAYCISNDSDTSRKPPTCLEQIIDNVDHSYSKASTNSIGQTKVEQKQLKDEQVGCSNMMDELGGDTSIRLDTVGAVVVDEDNNYASAISSGGLLLKYKGRIGQAAVPGAGCWAEDFVAVTTTGVGEYLTVSMFAKKFYDKISTLRLLYDLGHIETDVSHDDLSNFINDIIGDCFEDLARSPAISHVPMYERSAGLLSVSSINSRHTPKRVDVDDLYLSFAHNTKSMCIGYMTCNDTAGHSLLSHDLNNTNGSVLFKTIKISPKC